MLAVLARSPASLGRVVASLVVTGIFALAMASAGPSDKQAATRLPELAEWVEEIAGLTKPDAVVWCDGSQAEWDRLTSLLVENGTFTRLNPELRPNSFWCASDPGDVARVEDRTFICSEREQDAGPTNNWIAPEQMRKTFAEIFDGAMPSSSE